VGNLECIGGGGGGDVEGVGGEGEGGEGVGGEGEGGEGEGGEGEGGEGEGGEGEGGEGGEGEDGEGKGGEEGGEGGDDGEDSPKVMLRAISSPAPVPRSFSGVVSSLEVETRVAAAPLFLARTAARWLERVAVSNAFALFRASGRAL